MAKMGFRKLNDMIGRCDLLEPAEPLNAKVKVSWIWYSQTLLCLNTSYFLLWISSCQSYVREYAGKWDIDLCFLTLLFRVYSC